MKKLILKTALLAAAMLALPMSANAVPLVASVDGNLVNDTVAHLTWAADMNLMGTQAAGYTGGSTAFFTQIIADWGSSTTFGSYTHTLAASDFTASGAMTWFGALAWVNYLNKPSYEGYSDWRLPTGGELSYLFVTDLGNKANQSVLNTVGDTAEQMANLALFSNVKGTAYWSGTDGGSNTAFYFYGGSLGNYGVNNKFYAVAVRDVSPIPEPETYALMLAGLALVGAAARRRKAK